jgi:hypothetical protein
VFLPPGKSIPIVTAPHAGHEPLIFLIPQRCRFELGRRERIAADTAR